MTTSQSFCIISQVLSDGMTIWKSLSIHDIVLSWSNPKRRIEMLYLGRHSHSISNAWFFFNSWKNQKKRLVFLESPNNHVPIVYSNPNKSYSIFNVWYDPSIVPSIFDSNLMSQKKYGIWVTLVSVSNTETSPVVKESTS